MRSKDTQIEHASSWKGILCQSHRWASCWIRSAVELDVVGVIHRSASSDVNVLLDTAHVVDKSTSPGVCMSERRCQR